MSFSSTRLACDVVCALDKVGQVALPSQGLAVRQLCEHRAVLDLQLEHRPHVRGAGAAAAEIMQQLERLQ